MNRFLLDLAALSLGGVALFGGRKGRRYKR